MSSSTPHAEADRAPCSVAFPKRCLCGASWDRSAWHALPLVGRQVDDGDALELRTCTCQSTIAVVRARRGDDDDVPTVRFRRGRSSSSTPTSTV